MKTTNILNITLDNITQDELLAKLDKGMVVTPNLDHMVKLQTDREFYELYKNAEWVVCDSKILHAVSKLQKNSIIETIPGSSFFTAFYMHHKDNKNCKIFLLGAAPGVADKAMARINERAGRDIVIGAHSPSFGFEKNEAECDEIVNIINASGANVVVVGVGAPKQEKWIAKYRDRMPNVDIWMALGATIDFEAGNLTRAPKLVQRMCMEWFYRFLHEPRRLFKRYFIDDTKFFAAYTKQLLGLYKNPFASKL